MLAPSHTNSTETGLPVPLPSPVRVMSDMIHRYLARQVQNQSNSEDENSEDKDLRDNNWDINSNPRRKMGPWTKLQIVLRHLPELQFQSYNQLHLHTWSPAPHHTLHIQSPSFQRTQYHLSRPITKKFSPSSQKPKPKTKRNF